MLDLSIQHNLYKCKWVDGTVITLKPPTQAVYKELLTVQNADTDEAIDKIYSVVEKVLKNNTNKKELDGSVLGVDVCLMLLEDYFAFYTNELNNIVFQQSQ